MIHLKGAHFFWLNFLNCHIQEKQDSLEEVSIKSWKGGDVRWSIKIGWLNLWEQSLMQTAWKPFFRTATPKASRDPHFGKACLGNKELNDGLFCCEHNFPVTASFLNPSRVSRARFLQCRRAEEELLWKPIPGLKIPYLQSEMHIARIYSIFFNLYNYTSLRLFLTCMAL